VDCTRTESADYEIVWEHEPVYRERSDSGWVTHSSYFNCSALPSLTAAPRGPKLLPPSESIPHTNSNGGLVARVCENPATDAGLLGLPAGLGLVSALTSVTTGVEAFSATAGLGGAVFGVLGVGCSLAVDSPNSSSFAESACYAFGGSSVALGVGAVAAAPSIVGGLLLGAASFVTGMMGGVACLNDPPDVSFTKIAVAHVHPVQVHIKQALSPGLFRLLNLTVNSVEKFGAYGEAMRLCIDRASGAELANSAKWERRQHQCAAYNSRMVASLYRAQIPLRRALSHALKAAGLRDQRLSRRELLSTIRHPDKRVRRTLLRSGLSAASMRFVEQDVRHLPLGRHRVSLLGAVDGSKTVSALKTAARAFDAIAADQEAAIARP
jgi:hypothetical protein